MEDKALITNLRNRIRGPAAAAVQLVEREPQRRPRAGLGAAAGLPRGDPAGRGKGASISRLGRIIRHSEGT